MKKIFLVKKDVNGMRTTDNWIEMNMDEFKEFIKTVDGKRRKNNFAPLLGFDSHDADYFIETSDEEIRKIRKVNNRHAYLKKLEKASGIITVSLNDPDLFDNSEREDIIVDETAFVETISVAKETSQEIKKALMMLTDKQRDIICSLIYTETPMKVKDYANMHGLTCAAVVQTKERALKKLKKILMGFGIGG